MESIMRLTENNNKDNSDMKRIIFVLLCVVLGLVLSMTLVAQNEDQNEAQDGTPTATPDTACLLYTSPSPRD